MKLQDSAIREWHLLAAFVDQAQRVTVARHLLLGAALRRGVFQHQRLQPVRRDYHPLQPVG